MRIAFIINTAGQVNFHKNIISKLIEHGHSITVLARDHGETITLLNEIGMTYDSYFKAPAGKATKLITFPVAVLSMCELLGKRAVDLIVTFGIDGAFASRLLGIPSVVFTDSEPTPIQLLMLVPTADVIITPSCFRKNLGKKHIKVNGYKELSYLHPTIFEPNQNVLKLMGLDEEDEYAILRFNAFDCVHDFGVKGIGTEQKRRIAAALSQHLRVFISSESPLPPDLERFSLQIPKSRIHDAIYYAKLVFGDTQTMITEAGILGTPAVRCNSFVGDNDMGNFMELESQYGLVLNFRNPDEALKKAIEIATSSTAKKEWHQKRARLLSEKIDMVDFMVGSIEKYAPRHPATC
ncbi:MAG TPA: DUF354 domain-containing protein [Thermoplasmata archaeon]